MTDRLGALSQAGVAVWLDDVSRERLNSGNLAELVRDYHVVGVTSNPTIFAKAMADADDYAGQLTDLAIRGVDLEEAVRALTTYDIRWACDILRPAYDASSGIDGRVSIEVDPRLARDTDRTIAEARALWWLVDRPNLFIKIPATKEGLPAITAALAEGISVNVTLIFSLQRYREVMDAFLAGMEQAKTNGHDLSAIGSVASFFVSRVDTEVDKRLEAVSDSTPGGTPEAKALRSKAAIANARLAFEAYEEVFRSNRWQALQAVGARPQRPLWASTSTKDPNLSDTLYVEELVTNGVVNTMPEKTIMATAEGLELQDGRAVDTVRGRYDDARAVLAGLADLGISYDDVVAVLEDEGVEKFSASWKELLETVERELMAARSAAKGGSPA